MGWQGRWVIGLCAVAMLSACATAPSPIKAADNAQRRHVSPPEVPAPVLPDGSFDRARARAGLAGALAARRTGQLPEARRQAEAAVEAWPADPAAWQALSEICQASGDLTCRRQADFFRAKVDYANTLPIRAAVLGFQTIAEEPVGAAGSGITYDRRSLDAARRLWAFYNVQDTGKDDREPPGAPSFAEEYPYASAIIAAGIIAGTLTVVKSLANK